MGFSFRTILTLFIALFQLSRAVEYLQSGVTVAIHKDISGQIAKYFWADFKKNLMQTVFCTKGCPFNYGVDRLQTAINSNITVYNFTIHDIEFSTDNNVMVLIESSQTIKIVVERLRFNTSFDFVSDSPLYSDKGSGNFANDMTITLAVAPGYCNVTGRFLASYNSIVVQVFDLEKNTLNVTSSTIPMMQVRRTLETWRLFILNRVNEMLKLFREDIEDYLNESFSDFVYDTTDPTDNPDIKCPLHDPEDIRRCPLAVPIRNFFNNFEQSKVCMCQNLIDYDSKTFNPSIREDFISTRLYAMTFAPNSTYPPVLANSSDLKFMPTYESDKAQYLIQSFISEDFLNIIIDSFTVNGTFGLQILNHTDYLGPIS